MINGQNTGVVEEQQGKYPKDQPFLGLSAAAGFDLGRATPALAIMAMLVHASFSWRPRQGERFILLPGDVSLRLGHSALGCRMGDTCEDL